MPGPRGLSIPTREGVCHEPAAMNHEPRDIPSRPGEGHTRGCGRVDGPGGGGAWGRRAPIGGRGHGGRRGPPGGPPSGPCAWRYRRGRLRGPCRRRLPGSRSHKRHSEAWSNASLVRPLSPFPNPTAAAKNGMAVTQTRHEAFLGSQIRPRRPGTSSMSRKPTSIELHTLALRAAAILDLSPVGLNRLGLSPSAGLPA